MACEASRDRLAGHATIFLRATRRLIDTLCRRRVFGEFFQRAHRSSHQLAAAIRATSFELLIGTVAAKRTFESADHGFQGLRWKIFVTAFATGSQCQHGSTLLRGNRFNFQQEIRLNQLRHDQQHRRRTCIAQKFCTHLHIGRNIFGS